LELITEAVLPSETRDFEKGEMANEFEYPIRGFVTEKKKKCPVHWPCKGAEAVQGRYIATMYKITEMDRLHEKYELHCSPLRIPEEYLVIFMCAFETKTFKNWSSLRAFATGVCRIVLISLPFRLSSSIRVNNSRSEHFFL
jgi:hypothetical protein